MNDTAPCLRAARAHDARTRIPFLIETADRSIPVGSIDRRHVPFLLRWRDGLRIEPAGVHLTCQPDERTAWFERVNRALQFEGLIRAWRHELYGVVAPHLSTEPMALIERAASRFWGTLTYGAHGNGYVTDSSGRPTHLWLGERAASKATDPGMLDNVVGGGVPWPQTPRETLVREGWEEAGLDAATLERAETGSVFELYRNVEEGLQHEQLHVFDILLDRAAMPANQDGEVAAFHRVTIDDAVELAMTGRMTVDSSLATLDFASRRGLLKPAQQQQELDQQLAGLHARSPVGTRPVR